MPKDGAGCGGCRSLFPNRLYAKGRRRKTVACLRLSESPTKAIGIAETGDMRVGFRTRQIPLWRDL